MKKKDLKRSYRRYFEFRAQGSAYIQEKGDTRFSYAIKKAIKKNEPVGESYTELTQDIQIDNALVDEKTKKILKDSKGNPEHTTEKLKEAKSKVKKLMAKEVEIVTPDVWPDVPEDLTIDEIETLEGFVINPDLVSDLIEKILVKSDQKKKEKEEKEKV